MNTSYRECIREMLMLHKEESKFMPGTFEKKLNSFAPLPAPSIEVQCKIQLWSNFLLFQRNS